MLFAPALFACRWLGVWYVVGCVCLKENGTIWHRELVLHTHHIIAGTHLSLAQIALFLVRYIFQGTNKK